MSINIFFTPNEYLGVGKKIGEEFLGPWLDFLIDKAFDCITKAKQESTENEEHN